MDSGKSHTDCLCENESQIAEFNKAVEQLVASYPNLETLDLVTFRTTDGELVSQSLVGIKRQAETELTCE